MMNPSPPHTLSTFLVLLSALSMLCSGVAMAQAPEKLWVEKSTKARDSVLKASSISSLAGDISPAVVNIIVTMRAKGGPEPVDGEIPDARGGQTAIGSGFIIHPDGYVLTNNHVVEHAVEIKVKLNDKREYPAYVIGTDPRTDVALVRIESKRSFKAVALGNSDRVKVGEQVIAIGNPLGLEHTVTSGIISALGRKNLAPGGRVLESDFIQTDASINPGNSGGPLINMSGEVIGINTAINRQGQGIGFAIPINLVKLLIPQLQEKGYVERTRIGFRVQPLNPQLAKSFGYNKSMGALVSQVFEKTPAALAGFLPGDIILEYNGIQIRDSAQLPSLIATSGTSRPVSVLLVRAGKERTLSVQLETIPNQSFPEIPSRKVQRITVNPALEQLGLETRDLDQKLAVQLGTRDTNGVVVSTILEASVAKRSGLRKLDVILELDSTPIRSVAEFQAAAAATSPGEVVRLKISRGDSVTYVAFER